MRPGEEKLLISSLFIFAYLPLDNIKILWHNRSETVAQNNKNIINKKGEQNND